MNPVQDKKFEYSYDKEYFKSINDKVCPECESGLNKKGIKTNCTNCTLIIYGNPELISYNITPIQKKREPVKDWIDSCTHDDIFYDDIRSEVSCKICGLVIAGRPHYVAGSLKVEFPEGYIFEDFNNPKNK